MPRGRWVAVVVLVLLAGVPGCTSSPTVDPSPTPSASPVSPADLSARVEDYVGAHGLRYETIRSVRVQVDGESRLALYRGDTQADSHLHVWSVTKSVVSMLIGIAIEEGKISGVDATLDELLPEKANQMTPIQRGITLEQLLTMTSGMPDDGHLDQTTFEVSVYGILQQKLQAEPGQQFIYSNIGAHLISIILAEATREAPLTYARRVLFGPLSIDSEPAYTRFEPTVEGSADFQNADFAWATDADGVNNGCCMLRLTADDMVVLGELYLNEGMLGDRVVVPAEWVAASTQPSAVDHDYGYLWWRQQVGGTPAVAAVGAGGQLIVVVPDHRAVITIAAEPNESAQLETDDVLALIDEVIAPALG